MHEFQAIGESICEFASDETLSAIGTALDESLGDEVRATLFATGLGHIDQLHKP